MEGHPFAQGDAIGAVIDDFGARCKSVFSDWLKILIESQQCFEGRDEASLVGFRHDVLRIHDVIGSANYTDAQQPAGNRGSCGDG